MMVRQRRFVLEYLVDADGTKAAIRAGYIPSRAATSAWRLLRRPDVRRLLHRERAARAARTGITPERVLAAYEAIAFADIRRIARWRAGEGMSLRPPEALAAADAAAIAEIIGEGPQVRLFDKRPALAVLARTLGLAAAKRGPGPRGLTLRRVAEAARRVQRR